MGGVRVGVLVDKKDEAKSYYLDKVIVSATVRTKDDEFPLAGSKAPSAEELKVIEVELKTATSGAAEQPSTGGAPQSDPLPPEGAGGASAANDANMEEATSAAPDDAEPSVGSKRERPVVDPSVVEREVKRVKHISGKAMNNKRRKENYDSLDDVPLHIKRARANAVVCDPEVIEYLRSSGHFAEQCWACAQDAAQPVCRECLD